MSSTRLRPSAGPYICAEGLAVDLHYLQDAYISMGMIAMAKTGDEKPWTPTLRKSAGPVYLAIAGALSDDIRAGPLPAGARLPTQRELADALGIHFTTVTRAY